MTIHAVTIHAVTIHAAPWLSPLLLLALTSCGSDSAEPAEPARCTVEATRQLVAGSELSKLLEAAVDEVTRGVLLDAAVGNCCPVCGGAPEARASKAAAQACVACAAGYQSGDPGAHITSCAARVCAAP